MVWVRAWSAMGQAIHVSVESSTFIGELTGGSWLRHDFGYRYKRVHCLCNGSPFCDCGMILRGANKLKSDG